MAHSVATEESADGYAAFIVRLDVAMVTLRQRQTLTQQTLPLVTLLHRQNSSGHQIWTEKRTNVEGLVADHSAGSASYGHLADLLQSARKLERTFAERSDRLKTRIETIERRQQDIEKSLERLEKSKQRLNESVRLTKQRESLNEAIAALEDGLSTSSLAADDVQFTTDLKAARQAVFSAEALLELKGQ